MSHSLDEQIKKLKENATEPCLLPGISNVLNNVWSFTGKTKENSAPDG